ncbi:MAG: hypothetical protein KBC57_10735 [Neisseriaceae bacterium]|nr:hypothetical protein [Neisseriaceae bacterium]MBP6862814.1 hypothetical protein [Neisseriaceae bacterium]
MMTKITYCLALVLPAVFYYFALSIWPQALSRLWLGWPLSVLLGLLVMLWAALVGLWFARQAVRKQPLWEGEHE